MTDNNRHIRVRKEMEHGSSKLLKIPLPGLLNLNEQEDLEFQNLPEARERASEIIRRLALAQTVAAAEQFTHEFIQWAGQ